MKMMVFVRTLKHVVRELLPHTVEKHRNNSDKRDMWTGMIACPLHNNQLPKASQYGATSISRPTQTCRQNAAFQSRENTRTPLISALTGDGLVSRSRCWTFMPPGLGTFGVQLLRPMGLGLALQSRSQTLGSTCACDALHGSLHPELQDRLEGAPKHPKLLCRRPLV